MIYAFWISCDSEQHAREICAENGLTFRHARFAPELRTPQRGFTKFGARRHIRGNLMHFRAVKECTPNEALALNEKFGYGETIPEEVGTTVG